MARLNQCLTMTPLIASQATPQRDCTVLCKLSPSAVVAHQRPSHTTATNPVLLVQ